MSSPEFLRTSVIHNPERLQELNQRYTPQRVEDALIFFTKFNMPQTFEDVERMLEPQPELPFHE